MVLSQPEKSSFEDAQSSVEGQIRDWSIMPDRAQTARTGAPTFRNDVFFHHDCDRTLPANHLLGIRKSMDV
jgi:hypothetical protein